MCHQPVGNSLEHLGKMDMVSCTKDPQGPAPLVPTCDVELDAKWTVELVDSAPAWECTLAGRPDSPNQCSWGECFP